MTARATLAGVVALLAVVAPAQGALAQDDAQTSVIVLPYQPPTNWSFSRRSMPIPVQRVTVRDRPTLVDELDATPEYPPSPQSLGYDARIRASSDAAEGLMGPLDGAWVVSAADGRALVVLQLVDPGDGSGRLEGAWRDLMTPDGVEPVGLIDSLARGSSDLIIRFQPRGAGRVLLQVRPDTGGGWSGQMFDGDKAVPITMRPA